MTRTTLRPPLRFHARCNLTSKVREKKLDAQTIREYGEAGHRREFVRHDREGRLLEPKSQYWAWYLPACAGFETTDPAAFEAHMRDEHGRKSSTWWTRADGWAAFADSIRAGHRAPRLVPDGKPLVTKAGLTVTCPECGLVAEVGDAADGAPLAVHTLWWREHLERCVGTRAVEAVPA